MVQLLTNSIGISPMLSKKGYKGLIILILEKEKKFEKQKRRVPISRSYFVIKYQVKDHTSI